MKVVAWGRYAGDYGEMGGCGCVRWLVLAGAASAGPAVADPALTDTELDFIASVAPQGYGGDVYQTLKTGYRVCSMLDDGMSHEGIERFVVDTFGDSRGSARYYAALFSQYAAYNLCPRHLDQFGQI